MRVLASILLLAMGTVAFAHGEDELGPHQGYVRMSGAFHTEVIPAPQGIKVMLLDVNFENPTVENSAVEAVIVNQGKSTTLSCSTKEDYFFCKVSAKQLRSGELDLTPTKQGTKGPMVSYSLPLKLES